MKLLACGSRTFLNYDVVDDVLSGIWQGQNIGYLVTHMDSFVLIEGAAAGADAVARLWGTTSPLHSYGENDDQPFLIQSFPAIWDEHAEGWCPGTACLNRPKTHDYCIAAGPRRNQQMLDDGQPDLVVAFVDKPLERSRGTKDMVDRARAVHVKTLVIEIS